MRLLFFALALFSSSAFSAPPAQVSGTVTGLGAGKSVTLRNVQSNQVGDCSITMNADGPFGFGSAPCSKYLIGGSTYAVTITTQPSGQTCTVSGGSGIYSIGTPPNVSITCANTPAPGPSSPIPTLGEWGQIIMMLAMIATAGFYGWRMKQR